MIETLPLFHRISGRPVVVLGEGEAAEAKRRLVERAGAIIVTDLHTGIASGARLAFIALENDEAARVAVAEARSAGMLVNATDRPALCDFTVPSILDRSPVLVAIGTGGASAGLAKQLRLRLEALLPQSLGALASGLGAARAALRQRFPEAGERRRALDAALAAGSALDPLADSSADHIDAWLAGAPAGAAGVAEIALRSGDPEDLTLREARLLGTADVIVHDSRVPTVVLDRARADAVRLESDGLSPYHRIAGLTVVLRAPF
ncbi:siroheme synthase [Novosphingobium barchaimii LL02]|uniref:precorrin-2 dehydrogenase n=1 Tax=Novosphingobium barchaimii LL02 TaxID=1114963 RepID=A0A0J7XTN4_9SPHN|nr:NAD(P)-dependent oxidoreductase [Novosphingobium barchaimii]KMS55181.1 siroheme synthase [Novosphingobium barchaimii LL02]